AWRAEMGSLVRLAGPIVITQLGQMAIGITDVIMLGGWSKQALAAAALATSVQFGFSMLSAGPAFAVAPMVAHRRGADPDDGPGMAASVNMALWGTLLMLPPLIAILLFGEDLLLFAGEPADLAADAGRFLRVLCIGFPGFACYQAMRGYATALGR